MAMISEAVATCATVLIGILRCCESNVPAAALLPVASAGYGARLPGDVGAKPIRGGSATAKIDPDRTRPHLMRGRSRRLAMNVADVMTRKVISVTPETTIAEAARLMLRHRISGLPVVGEGGE